MRPSLSAPMCRISASDGRHRDLVADLLDDLGRVVRVLLLDARSAACSRTSGPRTAGCRRTTAAWLRVIRTDASGCSGYISADHVRRPELRLDEPRELARAPPCCVPRARGSRRGRTRTAARRRAPLRVSSSRSVRISRGGSVRVRNHAAVELDQLEGLDLLRLAVLDDFEVARLEVGDRLPFLSVTMTSTRTKLMPVRNTRLSADRRGWGAGGWPCGLRLGVACAAERAPARIGDTTSAGRRAQRERRRRRIGYWP